MIRGGTDAEGKTMDAVDVRRRFLDFFVERGHEEVPSSSIVPVGDPTLLFTNAGMNQFKDVFLGREKRSYSRAASCQKCLRVSGKHNDLETVGSTERHHTFFEMLGNFSFGDYFKSEAIRYAWDLMVEVYGISAGRLYATVYEKDEEAYALWREEIGIEPERIWRGGAEDNYWMMGEVGPCGPCSEIHYDKGEEFACEAFCREGRAVECGRFGGSDCPRFFELWNLVFMQYERTPDGEEIPLPNPCVDTGAGLERICAVVQGVEGNFQTDLFRPIIRALMRTSGRSYGDERWRMAFRVVADHVRALLVCIADGVLPGNEGRSYVVRRILRRAVRYLLKLGVDEPALWRLMEPAAEVLGKWYPEVAETAGFAAEVVQTEERSFHRTLERGMVVFQMAANEAGEGVISAQHAFRLYDTYGFPLDLTRLLARERGLKVDEDGFEGLLQRQRARSRASARFGREFVDLPQVERTRFVGYDRTVAEATVLHATDDMLILDETPFYAEAGGQVSDTGVVSGDGWRFRVDSVAKAGEVIVHRGGFEEGAPDKAGGGACRAEVDAERRAAIRRAHTATHILHCSLREVVGRHARQAGSLVEPDRLRFDFTHFKALGAEDVRRLERLVNRRIVEDHPVRVEEKTLKDARRAGATAIFEEKYREVVRVVSIGDFSKELCGGTHLERSSQVCLFRVVSESSVQAGVRRIEALTGRLAYELTAERERALEDACKAARVREACALPERVEHLRKVEREMRKMTRSTYLGPRVDAALQRVLAKAQRVRGVYVVATTVEGAGGGVLRSMVDAVKEQYEDVAVLLLSTAGGSVSAAVGLKGAPLTAGLDAGELAREVGRILGGSGGGRGDFAQAGGPGVNAVEEAVKSFSAEVAERIR